MLGSGGGAGGHGFKAAAAVDEVDHVQRADGGGVDAEKGLGEEVGGVVGRLEVFGVVDAAQGLDVALVKGGGAVEAQPAPCVFVYSRVEDSGGRGWDVLGCSVSSS